MVPTMEELCGCVTEWRDILLGKELEVNAAKSIVMVGHREVVGYSEIVSLWSPYEMSAGSVMCTGCKK